VQGCVVFLYLVCKLPKFYTQPVAKEESITKLSSEDITKYLKHRKARKQQ